ncbi:hypothetical protein [Fictibacillus sp. KU28468]
MTQSDIYLLIINSFKEVYLRLAKSFFENQLHRSASRNFIMNC